jgi:signal transduction histidine kinase
MNKVYRWFTGAWLTRSLGESEQQVPLEAVALRAFGVAYLVLFVVETFTTRPYPSLHGRGAWILLATITMIGVTVVTLQPRWELPMWRRMFGLGRVAVCAAILAALQPNGIWEAGPYFIAIIAALRLDRRSGILMLAFSLVLLGGVSIAVGRSGVALSVSLGAIPWFLVMRLMSAIRTQSDELAASREAEAEAAAAAERGRLAREMHDVLAHSLSALALQLESTRLLARNRGVDDDVARAVDQAHHLAASGLQEARRAIATARGDELPGPERLGALADAFGEQSGLSVALDVSGEPRELAPDARLAVYRTAQEALTNVRRHAAAQRVDMKLSYLPEGQTVLVVEDHGPPGTPQPVAVGVSGTGYGLTGMRERAALLGGELLTEPTADGFRVELRLPQ